jgi:hypothetical protein
MNSKLENMMETLRQTLIWLFGTFAIVFCLLSIVSVFFHGTTLLYVSDRAVRISHFYLLLAGIGGSLWKAVYFPDQIDVALLCNLPLILLGVGVSYLEPVCKIRKQENGCDGNHGREVSGTFFITSSDTTKLLETIDESFDNVSLAVM